LLFFVVVVEILLKVALSTISHTFVVPNQNHVI